MKEPFSKPLVLLVYALLIIAACAAPPPPTPTPVPPAPTAVPPLRIMPMGDSITEGLCDSTANCLAPEIKTPTGGYGLSACNWSLNTVNRASVGYRASLRDKLASAGIKATFVGSVSVVEGLSHEGHSGWTISDLDYCVQNANWLEGAKPDVILLHIGTNDMGWAHEPDRMIADLRTLLQHIYTHLPKSTHVIVAQVIPVKSGLRYYYVALPEPGSDTLAEYNALIPGLVAEFQTANYEVSYVNMWETIQSDADLDYAGLHPNLEAAARMSDVWLNEIKAIVSK
jgi:lysophospholipase L1-like esterase